MAAGDIVPVPGAQFEETLASASPDLLRAMIREFAQRMMDADVEVACNAGYGEVSPDRVNSRNGYRRREWDTRVGTIELAIPKLRAGSYFPGFLEHRRRAERALASVVATSYLLGVSTRRVEKLAASLGVTGLSKSQVSVMAAELDELVDRIHDLAEVAPHVARFQRPAGTGDKHQARAFAHHHMRYQRRPRMMSAKEMLRLRSCRSAASSSTAPIFP